MSGKDRLRVMEFLRRKTAELRQRPFAELASIATTTEVSREIIDGVAYRCEVHGRLVGSEVQLMVECSKKRLGIWCGTAVYIAMTPDGKVREDSEAW
jgi:hypothetical protein